MLPPHLLFAFFCLLLPGFNAASAFQQGRTTQDVFVRANNPRPIIQSPELSAVDSLKGTIQALDDRQSIPSCAKVASAELISRCATLNDSTALDDEGIPRGLDYILELGKTVYAARLAVCELLVAGPAKVPAECNAFVPTIPSTKKSYLSWALSKPHQNYPVYEERTEANVEQCLAALQSCSPCWVSYSNARQNAANICHAMRAEVEKDDQIRLSKFLAESGLNVAASMAESQEQWKEVRAAFNDVRTSIVRFSDDLAQQNTADLQQFRDFWIRIRDDVRTGMHNVFQEARAVETALANTRRSLSEHQQAQNEHFENTGAQLFELTVGQQHQMGVILAKGEQFLDKVTHAQELLAQGVIPNIHSVSQELVSTKDLAAAIDTQLGVSVLQALENVQRLGAMQSNIDEMQQSLRRMQAESERSGIEIQAKANVTLARMESANKLLSWWLSPLSWLSSANFLLALALGFLVFSSLAAAVRGFWVYSLLCNLIGFVITATVSVRALNDAGDLPAVMKSFFSHSSNIAPSLNDSLVFEGSPASLESGRSVIIGMCIGLALSGFGIWVWQSVLHSGARGQDLGQEDLPTARQYQQHTKMRFGGSVTHAEEKGSVSGHPYNDPKYWEKRGAQGANKWVV